MSFNKNIKEEAFIACRRHCVICGKFCGLNIEAHHIKPKYDGGEDTFDNCIPVCFDCHAIIGQKYNPKHNKGSKFSVSELMNTRNNFYEHIKSGVFKPNISEELSGIFESYEEVFKFIYEDCVKRNVFGNVESYLLKKISYNALEKVFLKKNISADSFKEIIQILDNKRFIKTNVYLQNGKMHGSVELTSLGIQNYENQFIINK